MYFGRSIGIHLKLFLLLIFSAEFSKSQVFETITIENCGDAASENWKFPVGWGMECYDDINSLKAKATADPYNDMISKNFNWSAFESAKGIWSFFNQDPPPELDVPSPAIEYQHLSSISKSIEITYFMYGNQSDRLVISTPCTKEVIFNQCGFHCDLTFVQSDRIQLDRGCDEEDVDCGATQFNIDLDTSPGQSFVFVDKIVVNKAKRQTQPALEASATASTYKTNSSTATMTTHVSKEEEHAAATEYYAFMEFVQIAAIDKCGDERFSNWEFPKRWLMFCFDDVESLKLNATGDKYNSMIPKDFDWSSFQHETGIWAFFYQDPPPEIGLPPPVISFHDTQSFESLEMTYYMFGNTDDQLKINTTLGKEVIANDCGFNCDLKFIESELIRFDKSCDEWNHGTGCGEFNKFDIALDTTPGQSFLFIDKIVVHKATVSTATSTPEQPTTLTITSMSSSESPITTYSTELSTEATETVDTDETTTYTTENTEITETPIENAIVLARCSDARSAKNWEFPTRWLMFCFDDIQSLRENATADTHNSMIPKNFDWSAFENDTGIWAFFYQDPPPEFGLPLPTISYHGNSMCRSVEITYFMHGNRSDRLGISTSYVNDVIINDCGFDCDLNFVQSDQIQLDHNCGEWDDTCGTTQFNIDLNITPGHSFVLIDKIVIYMVNLQSSPPPTTTTITTSKPPKTRKTTTKKVTPPTTASTTTTTSSTPLPPKLLPTTTLEIEPTETTEQETSTCKNGDAKSCNGSQTSLGNSAVFITLAGVMMVTVYYFQ